MQNLKHLRFPLDFTVYLEMLEDSRCSWRVMILNLFDHDFHEKSGTMLKDSKNVSKGSKGSLHKHTWENESYYRFLDLNCRFVVLGFMTQRVKPVPTP